MEASSKTTLQHIFCIRYPIQFQDNEVEALLDFGSEVNAIIPAYAAKLGLRLRPTNVGAQKIDGLVLETHGMTSARFLIQDSQGRV